MSSLNPSPPAPILAHQPLSHRHIDQIQELQPMFKGREPVVLKNGKSYPTTRPLREISQKLEFR